MEQDDELTNKQLPPRFLFLTAWHKSLGGGKLAYSSSSSGSLFSFEPPRVIFSQRRE